MRKTLSTIFRFSGGVKRYLALAVITTALAVFFQFLTPQVIRFTVDYVIGTEESALPAFVMGWIEGIGGRGFLRLHLAYIAAAVVL